LDVIQDVVEIKFDGDVAVSLSTEEKKISSLEALSSVDEIIFVKPNKESNVCIASNFRLPLTC
jgi:hypothetical protein